MRRKHIILLLLLSFSSMGAMAQVDTEFWFGIPVVTTGHGWGDKAFYFRFANMDRENSFVIDMPANNDFVPIEVNNFAPYEALTIDVTDIIQELWIEDPWDGVNPNTLYDRGIRITSQHDMTAYFEVGTRNNPDIFSLKGKNALGTDFFVPFQNRKKNGNYNPKPYSAIYIVATEDNTVVTVNPTNPVFPGRPAGVPFDVTLQRGEAVGIAPDKYTGVGQNAGNRLAGTRVQSTHPVVVTTSDDSVESNGGCKDLIGDQLIPVSIIGTEYIAMKGRLTEPEFFYVVATQNDTEIIINNNAVTTLDEGEMYRHQMTEAIKRYHIKSPDEKPVYVYHVAGFGCEVGGAVLPPINVCTGSFRVAFTRSKGGGNERFFLNILVRAGAEDGFILNDGPVNTVIPSNIFHPVPGTSSWLAAEIELPVGVVPVGDPSVLRNTKDVFHLGIINGGPSSGTMYGYFSNFNEVEANAGIGNIGEGTDGIFFCHGESQQLVSTDGVSHYWYPPDYLDDPHSQNPVTSPEESIVYNVVITGACQVTAEAQVAIYLMPPVNALFTVDESIGCAPFDVQITNETQNVFDYVWDFGDGQESYTDNASFTHTYQNTGSEPVTYDLQLAGFLAYCSDTVATEITVLPEVRTRIEVDGHVPDDQGVISVCAPFELEFTHKETLNVQQFLWNFGDGNTATQESPVHTFHNNTSEPITRTVYLQGSSEFGTDGACESLDSVMIEVRPAIHAGFEFDPPTHCNPYPITITNTTEGAGNSYWDFLSETDTLINEPQFTHWLVNETQDTEHTIRLYVENEYGCFDELERNVTVYPLLTAEFEPSETVVCEPGFVDFANLSAGAAEYHWDFDGAGSSSLETPSGIRFDNHDTENDQVYNVKLTTTSQYGCVEEKIVPITVAPRLKSGFSIDDSELCSPHGDAVLQIQNNSIGATSVDWKITNNHNAIEIAFSESASQFSHTFNNTADVPVTYTLTQRVENHRGCTDAKSMEVTVYPRVKAEIVPVESGCHPLEVTFNHNALNAESLRWEFSDGTSYTSENVSKTFVNTSYTEPLEVEARLFAESAFGCRHDTLYTFVVHPKPRADFDIPLTQGCAPLTLDMVDNSIVSGSEAYEWKFGVADPESLEPGDVEFTFQNNTDTALSQSVSLKVTNEFGCEDITERNVLVYPGITSAFDVDIHEGCDPLEVTFSNKSIGASSSQPYFWDYGNGTSEVTETFHSRVFRNLSHTETKTYTVKLQATSLYGCKHEITEQITVNPRPKASYAADNHTGCSPLEVDFTDFSSGSNLQYQWYFKNDESGQESGDTSFEYVQPWDAGVGQFASSLVVTNEFGCRDSVAKNITVYPEVIADFTFQEEGCHPLEVQFDNESLGASQFQWTFDDGNLSNDQNPSNVFFNHTYDEVKTYNVQLHTVSVHGCDAEKQETITVFPLPEPSFTLSETEGCSPMEIEVFDNSAGTGNESFFWQLGDDTSEEDELPMLLFENDGELMETLEISLLLTNEYGCYESFEQYLTVYPNVKAEFTVDELSGCDPLEVNFSNLSEGKELMYSWDYGNGTSDDGGDQHTRIFRNFGHNNPVNFVVGLEVESVYGCKDDWEETLTVYPVPKADFAPDLITGCAPLEVSLEDLSLGSSLSYSWEMGDGSTEDTGGSTEHTFFVEPGGVETDFFPHLTVTNTWGCQDSFQRKVTVYPQAEARFTTVTESGCHPLEVGFSNISTGEYELLWSFGDGNVSDANETVHTFFNNSWNTPKEFTVSLDVLSPFGCEAQADTLITVFPVPVADFTSSVEEGCSPLEVSVVNQSQGTGNETFFWQAGNFSSDASEGFMRIFDNSGEWADTLQVSLLVENEFGCQQTTASQLVVFPDISAEFSIEGSEGCHPLEPLFINQSQGASASEPYRWVYGNGTSSIEAPEHSRVFHNFSHTAAETFDVTLFTTSRYGCKDSVVHQVEVFPVPHAGFETDLQEGCSPLEVNFEDQSLGSGLSYQWTFEEGEEQTQPGDAVYTYTQPWDQGQGIFTGSLLVTNSFGCFDEHEQVITVFPDIVADFNFTAEGCHPLEVQFENESLGASLYHWRFDDGNFSSSSDPVHIFKNNSFTQPQNFEVILDAESSFGCQAQQSGTVTVFPRPAVNFSMENSKGCSPLEVTFNDLTEGVSQYEWMLDGESWDGDESVFQRLFVNQGEEPDTLLMSLTGSNQWGCARNVEEEVVVYPEVTAAFTFVDELTQGCTPLALAFQNESQLAHRYEWSFGDGAASSHVHPTHTFYNNTSENALLDVELAAISTYGCQDQTSGQVTVFARPVADFDASPHRQFYPERTVYVSNYSGPGDWEFHWDLGNGHTFSTSDRDLFDYTYPWTPGDYASRSFDITLTVSSEHCSGQAQQKVEILAPFPIVGFSPAAEGCPPLEVQFYNETMYGDSFFWDFDNGHTSDSENPVHIFDEPGTYNVMLRIAGEGGIDSTYQTITVFEPPVADFRIESRSIELPYEWAQFENLSANAYSYWWEFGDGNVSDEEHPRHYFAETGNYDITLTVGNDTDPQCTDSMTKSGMVSVQDMSCQLLMPNAFKPLTEGATGGAYSLTDPSNHVFHPMHEGIEEYKLEVFNRWGELIFMSEDIWTGWDGYHRGVLAPVGVYVYKVKAKCATGEVIEKTGDVTLVQ